MGWERYAFMAAGALIIVVSIALISATAVRGGEKFTVKMGDGYVMVEGARIVNSTGVVAESGEIVRVDSLENLSILVEVGDTFHTVPLEGLEPGEYYMLPDGRVFRAGNARSALPVALGIAGVFVGGAVMGYGVVKD